MIGYPSRQDRASLHARDYPPHPTRKIPRKPNNKSFTGQPFSVKMAGYWPRSFFESLWTSALSRSINTQEREREKNREKDRGERNLTARSSPLWSITHICWLTRQDPHAKRTRQGNFGTLHHILTNSTPYLSD